MTRVFGWSQWHAGEWAFRIGRPFPLLDKTRFDATFGPELPDDIADYDVVFAHRMTGYAPRWIELCENPNILCVYDMDDDVLCVDPQNTQVYRVFHPHEAETRRNVLAADIVTTSSPVMRDRYAEIHPNVAYLPICIPDDLPDAPFPEREGLTVGWAGSAFKRQDWPGVTEALVRYSKLVPQARFRMYGGDYTDGLLGSKCEFVPFTDVDTFWWSLNFDIGVAPLIDTKFNRSKTVTKLIEYGARGIPTIASAIGQNVDWIDHGVNGFLVHDRSEWVPYLLALTDDATRHAMAKAAHDTSREWTFGKHIHLWEEVFTP